MLQTQPRSEARFGRAIFLMLDGARADVFRELLAAGELPNVARYIVEPGGFSTATTVFPSVTGVAYAPYLTGYFPETTNLPGVKWLDRRQYAKRKFSVSRFRNYTGPGHFMMDRDLSPQINTLFELLSPATNIFGTISRGTGPHRNAFLFRRVPWALHFLMTGDWAPIDRRSNEVLLRVATRRRTRYVFHTTLQVDEHSHADGPFSPRAREGYRAFDRTVGQLVSRLRMVGQLERTLLTLGADHGHTDVHEHFDLELFFEKRQLKTLYYPKAFQRWFDCDVAVMVGGNAMGHVYFRGRGWDDDQETGEERLARLPGIVDDLLAEPAVDILAWRAGSDGTVAVRSRRGAARVRLEGDKVHYYVEGTDPFGYGPLPTVMTRDQALLFTKDEAYPDGPVQVAQLFGCERTGDLIVSATKGWDLRGHHMRHQLRSGHGALIAEHMNVPFAMSAPFDASRGVRTVDMFPSLLHLLGEGSPTGTDGRDLVGEPLPAGVTATPARRARLDRRTLRARTRSARLR